MENIFNHLCVLSNKQLAVDDEYINVEYLLSCFAPHYLVPLMFYEYCYNYAYAVTYGSVKNSVALFFPPSVFLPSVPSPSRPLTPSSLSRVINFPFDSLIEVCEMRERLDSTLLECHDRWTCQLEHSRWCGRRPPRPSSTSRPFAESNKNTLNASQRSRKNWFVPWQGVQI